MRATAHGRWPLQQTTNSTPTQRPTNDPRCRLLFDPKQTHIADTIGFKSVALARNELHERNIKLQSSSKTKTASATATKFLN